MTYEVDASPRFARKGAKFFRPHPDLESRFESVVIALAENPFEPSFRIPPLSGKLKRLRTVWLTYEYWIVLVRRVEERHNTLIDIGSHDNA